MIDSILNELEKSLNNLKVSVINNSLTAEEAKIEFNKIMFAAKTLKRSLKQNSLIDEKTSEEILKVQVFIKKLLDLRMQHLNVFDDVDIVDKLSDNLKTHLPDRIHTDGENELTVE